MPETHPNHAVEERCTVQINVNEKRSAREVLGARLDLVDICLTRALIDRSEEGADLGVFGKPRGHAVELFTKPINCLMIHVRLGDEFRHGNCEESQRFLERVFDVDLPKRRSRCSPP
jgi:hypothetical protein